MPRVTLIGNKTDLNHLRTVKVDKHNQFADENEMFSCFMSAKTGDNVSQCFYRVAADLAGVVLTKPELEVATKVVRAEIINHPQNDEAASTVSSKKKGGPAPSSSGAFSVCLVPLSLSTEHCWNHTVES